MAMPPIIREYFQGRKADPAWTVTETGQTIFIGRILSLTDAERLRDYLSEREYLVTVMQGDRQGTSWTVTARPRGRVTEYQRCKVRRRVTGSRPRR